MYEINGEYLNDERENLDIQLSQPILVIGDLGMWNGRRMGYKEIASGNIFTPIPTLPLFKVQRSFLLY